MKQTSDDDDLSIRLRILFALPILLSSSSSAPASASAAVDPNFEACRNQATCGGLNISFPFYIRDQQQALCGFPGFDISCLNDQPLLNLSNALYIIRGVDYRSQSVRVVNANLSRNWTRSCESPRLIQNLTLVGDQFKLEPDVKNLFLFYNCDASSLRAEDGLSQRRINCSTASDAAARNSTLLGLYGDDPEMGNASRRCKSVVEAPVEAKGGGGGTEFNGSEAAVVIGRGFGMKWTASNCSKCEDSGGKCGFDYESYQLKCFCPDRPHFCCCVVASGTTTGNDDRSLKIGLGGGIGTLFVMIIILSIFMIRYRKTHKYLSKNNSAENSLMSELAGSHVYFEVPIFQNKELEEATNNFHSSKELGDGGFGIVYHGKLRDGREVAVKRLYEHNYRRMKQFMTEVQILTRLHHKNLVSLYGCTSRQSRELLLVYEYIPNGTVADHLHGERAQQGSFLPWSIRMNIAVETATALAYLHASAIIHRDVKTSNILLDDHFCVKVADFGLSRLFPDDVTHVSTAPQGTPGYVDPEYYQCYQLTEKSDVYSFGVVLVELLSSMPAVDISRDRHEINLANLAINRIQSRALHELIDPRLGYNSDIRTREAMTGMAELAFSCLQQEKDLRPSMDSLLKELEALAGGTKTAGFSPSPESDEARLLKKPSDFPASPISVTQKWVSNGSSGTPATSSSNEQPPPDITLGRV